MDKPQHVGNVAHGIVFREPNQFAGWPFNNGLWRNQAGHLLVGFLKNRCAYSTATDCSHRRSINAMGAELVVMRSEDDGVTWPIETAQVLARYPELSDRLLRPAQPEDYAGEPALDPADSNVLLASGSVPDPWGEDSRAWVRISGDGGLTWREPILLPLCAFKWLQGRPATLVRPDGTWLLFLTASRRDGSLGRVVAYASSDGGRHWNFLSYVGDNSADHLMSCPQPVLLADGTILAAVRCQRTRRAAWTEILCSEDGGRSWHWQARVNDWGAPAHLVVTNDGRLLCVYGYRMPPFGIRGRVSEDGGRKWGSEIILREDGGSWDLGYPRVIETSPGQFMAVYYFNLADDPVQMDGGVRHIATTHFSLD